MVGFDVIAARQQTMDAYVVSIMTKEHVQACFRAVLTFAADGGTVRQRSISVCTVSGSTLCLLAERSDLTPILYVFTGEKRVNRAVMHLTSALGLEGVVNLPDVFLTKKYARVQLASGVIAGSLMAAEATNQRNYLLQADSEDLERRSSGALSSVPMTTYGVAMHHRVVFVDNLFAFAYVECTKSSVDRLGRCGRPEKKHDMDCFSALERVRKYVPALAVGSAEWTLCRNGKHFI